MKEQLEVSMPKPGKDKINPSSYRPISLTSCVTKLLERMVRKHSIGRMRNSHDLVEAQACRRKSDILILSETNKPKAKKLQ